RDVVAAENAYRKAVERKPDDPEGLMGLARALLDQDKISEATAFLRRAAALDPHNPEAHQALASALAQLGKARDAEQVFRKAIELFESEDVQANKTLEGLPVPGPGGSNWPLTASARWWKSSNPRMIQAFLGLAQALVDQDK